jgi:DegV family protein with EDD domain
MAIKIITDTGCDLPKEMLETLNIDVMPLMVYLGEEEYRDGLDISHEEFYKRMRSGAKTRTSQVPTPILEESFLKYKDSGDDVLYISFSSNLSGTYQTAEMVKNDILDKFPEYSLHIVDSKCASIGFGLVVYYAAQYAKMGLSIEDLIKKVQEHCDHMEHIFTVDDLEYLFRGGRVSRGAAVMGTMLNIKPILDVEDGRLIPLQKIRTRKKAIHRMLEIMDERGVDLKNQMIAINHGDDLKTALEVKAMIQSKYGTENFIVNYVGCAIGAHSGPGTLSVFFLNKKL